MLATLNNLVADFPEMTIVEEECAILVCWNGEPVCRVTTWPLYYRVIPIESGGYGTKHAWKGSVVIEVLDIVHKIYFANRKEPIVALLNEAGVALSHMVPEHPGLAPLVDRIDAMLVSTSRESK